jgi:hypothetical protein
MHDPRSFMLSALPRAVKPTWRGTMRAIALERPHGHAFVSGGIRQESAPPLGVLQGARGK